MSEVKLACQCGQIKGVIQQTQPNTANPINCCCDDCRAFAEHLQSESQSQIILDEYGATKIYQLPVAKISLTQGSEHLRCLRLTEKGMYRWYSGCCNTPIGNTLGAGGPFIGVIHNFVDSENLDQLLGASWGYVHPKFALKPLAKTQIASWWALPKMLIKIGLWKLKGLNRPSAFFDNHSKPITSPTTINHN